MGQSMKEHHEAACLALGVSQRWAQYAWKEWAPSAKAAISRELTDRGRMRDLEQLRERAAKAAQFMRDLLSDSEEKS
jgi:hypothetical protein